MCFEYERDRDAQEDEAGAGRDPSLFERYRMARRREATVMAAAERDEEPALTPS